MAEMLKCNICGGDLEWNPGANAFKCEWCGNIHKKEELEGFSEKAQETITNTVETKETSRATQEDGSVLVTYKCDYCGGEITTLEETIATMCLYCHRPVTITGKASGAFKPDVIIPFKKTKDQALEAFKKYLKGKRFLPEAYKGNIDKLTGIYIPFWLYDGITQFRVEGEAQKVTTSKQGNYRVTKTDYFKIAREGSVTIKNTPVDASQKTPNNIMDSVEPYNFKELERFATPYLSGFLAEQYDETKETCYERAKTRFEGSAANAVKNTTQQYESVHPKVNETNITKVRAKYGLLPLWMMYSEFQGKTYSFAMNGQTGKMTGDLPVDKTKVVLFAIASWASFGGAAVIVKLIVNLFN
jgi:DNA-directed RNA polymerase subunit RPC12/RpoP